MPTLSESVTLPVTFHAAAPGAEATLSLPADLAEALGMTSGMALRAVTTPDGLLLSTATVPADTEDADFAEAMAAFDRVSERYKNTLRELAK